MIQAGSFFEETKTRLVAIMSDSVWLYWKLASEPEAGVFKVVMFAGLETSNTLIPNSEKVLFVCESLNGHPNIAFAWPAVHDGKVLRCMKNGEIV